MGGRFLNDRPSGRELGAAEDIAAADDDGELHAAGDDALQLAGETQRLLQRDTALTGSPETLA